jgi:SAM-dependent methyltransferase
MGIRDRVLDALRARLPAGVRRMLRRAAQFPEHARNALLGRRPPLLPPPDMWAVGEGEFRSVGADFLRLFREEGGLRSTDRVLDIGCGIGRMAVPLTDFLEGRATYSGFDVTQKGIRWCRSNITRRFPRFRFTFVDIANAEYNPHGSLAAAEFVFPYPDASFDFVFATSLFTHLLPESARRYLAETRRVLAPSGRFFLTLFVLDEAARAEIAAQRVSYRFEGPIPGAFAQDPAAPEAAIAYDESEFLGMLEAAGLRCVRRKRGLWCGGDPSSYQDILVCERREAKAEQVG